LLVLTKSRPVLSEVEVKEFSKGQDGRFDPLKLEFSPSLSGNIAPRKITGSYIREVRIKNLEFMIKLELRMFSIYFKTICLLISTF